MHSRQHSNGGHESIAKLLIEKQADGNKEAGGDHYCHKIRHLLYNISQCMHCLDHK